MIKVQKEVSKIVSEIVNVKAQKITNQNSFLKYKAFVEQKGNTET